MVGLAAELLPVEVLDWVREGAGVATAGVAPGRRVWRNPKRGSGLVKAKGATYEPETDLDFVRARPTVLLERLGEGVADDFDDLFGVLEANLALRGVHVDVDFRGDDLEGEVDERVRALGEQRRVEGFEGALEGCAVDEAVCSRKVG